LDDKAFYVQLYLIGEGQYQALFWHSLYSLFERTLEPPLLLFGSLIVERDFLRSAFWFDEFFFSPIYDLPYGGSVEWHAEKSDIEVQRLLGIYPMFWGSFRKQRDLRRNAPFERYWHLAKETDKALKTTSVNSRSLLASFVAGIT